MIRRRKRSRKLLWGLILVILVATGVVAAVIWNNEHQEKEEDEAEMIEEREVVDVEKRDGETEEEYSERLVEEKKVKQYEGEDPNKAAELSGAITYAGVNGGILMIGVNIDQFLSGGNCELNLLRDGNVIYTDSANIIADVSTSSCDGFNVLTGGLGSGATEIIINLSANGKAGMIRGEVNI